MASIKENIMKILGDRSPPITQSPPFLTDDETKNQSYWWLDQVHM